MMGQTIFLMRTLLLLKSWRLLLMLPILASFLFSIKLCHTVSQVWTGRSYAHHGVDIISPEDFANSRVRVTGDAKTFANEFAATKKVILLPQGNRVDFDSCSPKADCFTTVYSSMLLNNGDHQLRYHIDFGGSMAICQVSHTSMLSCAFLGGLAALSRISRNESDIRFHKVHTFQYVNRPVNTDSCTTEMSSFFVTLPNILSVEMALVTVIVCAYLLLATVSCINELKSRGFLQLMTRKGLSPFAYWASLWALTSVELLLFSASLALSFYLQCPRFISLSRFLLSFIIISAHLFCVTTFVLLLTVLSNRYSTICKSILLYIATSLAATLMNRLAHELEPNDKFHLLKIVLLMLPCGNAAEQLTANLLGHDSSEVENNFHTAGLIVNGLVLTILGMITLYLDHVLITGNALCYPACYLFMQVPADEIQPDVYDTRPCVESRPDFSVFVRVANISQKIVNDECRLSVDFYGDQITAVFGEDGARTGAFLSVLTGRLRATSGLVWIDGCTASAPMSRPHTHTRLGECLQEDALCHSLTVLHTLKMALVSSGSSWVDCECEVNAVTTLMRLADKLQCTVGSLSKGQRRKLCVALALLGNPKLVILNDPTRGLDPLSRQRLWRLLQEYRHGRCIVVSTQCVDEADMFADRKVFLSPAADSVICAGSSQFIRRAAGCTLVVQATLRDMSEGGAVLERLRASLPSGVGTSLKDSLLSVRLTDSSAHLLPDVLRTLRTMEQDISSVGLSHPLLSDVYKRLKGLCADEVNYLFLNPGDDSRSRKTAQEDKHVQPSQEKNADSVLTMPEHRIDSLKIGEKVVELQKSNGSWTGATCGIFCLNCLLFRRDRIGLFGLIPLSVILLTLHVFMLLMEKKSLDMGSSVWKSASKLPAKSFSRGVCVSSIETAKGDQVDDHQCSIFFSGGTTVGDNFMALQKSRKTLFYEWLKKPNVNKLLFDHCSKSKPTELPCSIVYANSWQRSTPNVQREFSVGSYSLYNRYKPEYAAAVTYKAFMAVIARFSCKRSVCDFKLAMFVDFQHALLPLYGVFSQIFILTTLPALLLSDVMEHRASKWLSYLTTMGVNTLGYWASSFLIHWLLYAAMYFLTVILSVSINPSVYMASYQIVVIALTTSCGLINNMMVAYGLTSLFRSSRRILPVMHLLLLTFIGMSPVLVQSMNFISIVLIAACPPFAVAALTFYCVKLYVYAEDLHVHGREAGLPRIGIMYEQRQIRTCLIAIPLHTVAFAVLFAVAMRTRAWLDRCSCASRGCGANGQDTSGDPVPEETGDQTAIVSSNPQSRIELQKLSVVYPKSTNAVRSVTLSVSSGETIGLVGSNGSGMTAVVSAIVGKRRPTSGRCQVRAAGSWLSGKRVGPSGLVAYSPQCNPLFDALTVKEHLLHYGRMLGARGSRVRQLLQDIGLRDCEDLPSRQLSEGRRRRLGVAISLLSCAPLLVIDDTSTGVKPDDEAHLWRRIAATSGEYLSVLISAHTLTGAEALGCRVALLNHGLLVFLGTVQQLRLRHGIHLLEIEFKSNSVELAQEMKAAILKAITGRFFSPEILDQSLTWLKISIPPQGDGPQFDSLRWLLQLKRHHGIASLTFYPATSDQLLEFVFKHHEVDARESTGTDANPDAPPIVQFYECYDI